MNYEKPDYSKLPKRLQRGVQDYIEGGHIPGHFLVAVITNNLNQAIFRADPDMIKVLPQIVRWFYNDAPGPCHGSQQTMEAWSKDRKENPATFV